MPLKTMDNLKENLVSVVIPCYNQAEYIEETVDSVLKQSYVPIEIIIVNDGSTDNSGNVIEEIISKYPTIKSIVIKNSGVSRARNIGIENAEGKYILPLDADDLIEPDYIKLAVEEFQKNPDLLVVTAKGRFFGKETGDWNLEDFSMKKMLHGNVVFCPSIFKKSDWQKVGGFDENMTHLEDWEFFIRLTSLAPEQVKRLDYRALNYRIKELGARNTEGFENPEVYHNNCLYIYNKHKNLYFLHYNNPLFLIKDLEKQKWEKEKMHRELNYLKRFFTTRILLRIRKIMHSK